MTAHFGHTELDAGSEAPRLRIVLSEGPLDKVQADPKVIEAYLGRGKERT